jgi:hypothetical protein
MDVEGRGTVEGAAVELMYRPTEKDWTAALRARAKAGRAGARQRRLLVVAATCGVVGMGVSMGTGKGESIPMPLVVGVPVAVLLLMLAPRLQARQIVKMAALQGEFRVLVDDSGVRVTTDSTSTVVGWQSQPRYVETTEQFVLLSPDKNAVGFTVLPKRGLQDSSDIARLRAILDRHLQRV